MVFSTMRSGIVDAVLSFINTQGSVFVSTFFNRSKYPANTRYVFKPSATANAVWTFLMPDANRVICKFYAPESLLLLLQLAIIKR